MAQIPLGRVGPPDDIGPVAVFVASGVAKFITGDVLFASAHFSKTDIANENQVEAAADSACGRLDGGRRHLLGDQASFVAGAR